MKLLHSVAGIVFILSLAVFLLTTFVRQGLLNETTWLKALDKGEAIEQFEKVVASAVEKKNGPEAAANIRKNLQLEELRQLMVGNVTSTMQFVRGQRQQLVFEFGQGRKYDVTAAAATSSDTAKILSYVRLGYRVLTIVWIASGVLSLLALVGVWAAGEPKRRLRPLAKLVIASAIITLFGSGIVGGIGIIIAAKSIIPVQVAGEIAHVDVSGVVRTLVISLVLPIIVTGLGLAVIGGGLLQVARKREPQVIALKVKTGKTGLRKKILIAGAIVVALSLVAGLVGAWRGGGSQEEGTVSSDGWQTHHNSKVGYWISLPPDWQLKDSPPVGAQRESTAFRSDTLAFVTILAIKDESMRQPGAVEKALGERVAGFTEQPGMTITDSSSKVEDDTGAYIVQGTEKVKGAIWNFHERGLIGRSGKVLIFHGSSDQSLGTDYLKTLSRIIESFKIE